jgi:hypothetical protein
LFCLKNPNIPHFAKNLTSTFISSIYPIHSITVLTLNFRFSHPSMRSTSISNLNFFSPITLCPHLTTYIFFLPRHLTFFPTGKISAHKKICY